MFCDLPVLSHSLKICKSEAEFLGKHLFLSVWDRFLALLLVEPAKGKVAVTSPSLGRAPEPSGVQAGLTKAFQEGPGLGLLEVTAALTSLTMSCAGESLVLGLMHRAHEGCEEQCSAVQPFLVEKWPSLIPAVSAVNTDAFEPFFMPGEGSHMSCSEPKKMLQFIPVVFGVLTCLRTRMESRMKPHDLRGVGQ